MATAATFHPGRLIRPIPYATKLTFARKIATQWTRRVERPLTGDLYEIVKRRRNCESTGAIIFSQEIMRARGWREKSYRVALSLITVSSISGGAAWKNFVCGRPLNGV